MLVSNPGFKQEPDSELDERLFKSRKEQVLQKTLSDFGNSGSS